MIKLLDPEQRFTWEHPADPDFKVEYKAYASPLFTTDLYEIARLYVNGAVTKVFNPDEVPKPAGGWTSILPSDVQSALFVAISEVSVLNQNEELDSPSPPGSASMDVTMTAGIAGGADGSV